MTPVAYGGAGRPEARRDRAGASEGFDDGGCVHAANLSEHLTLDKENLTLSRQTFLDAATPALRQRCGMAILLRSDLVRRLRAVRQEMRLTPTQMAERLGITRPRYSNWEVENPAKPSFPAEEYMMTLCDTFPDITMDYLYRGKLDTLPLQLAIRLSAWERGMDPDAPEFSASDPIAAGLAATKPKV